MGYGIYGTYFFLTFLSIMKCLVEPVKLVCGVSLVHDLFIGGVIEVGVQGYYSHTVSCLNCVVPAWNRGYLASAVPLCQTYVCEDKMTKY